MMDERTDLLTMSGDALRSWWADHFGVAEQPDLDAFAALRDAIVTAARQSDRKREAVAYGERARALCFERHPRGKLVELRRACDACAADAASVEAEGREVARKAWDAAWELASPKGESNQNVRNIMHTQWTRERDRYLDAHHPLPPRECVLSDGRTVEWMDWESRGGVAGVRTLDIVTNKGKTGMESRQCFQSLDDMHVRAKLSWADWLTINEHFAAEVGR